MQINIQEESLEKSLLNEEWFNYSKNIDIEKFKKRLINLTSFFNYQKELLASCTEKVIKHVLSKKNLFESKNCRSLVRGGVPCKYMRELLLKLFNIPNTTSEEFKVKRDFVFKDFDSKLLGDYVPYLTGFDNLNESLPTNFLNEKGILELKEIMWMLNSANPSFKYSPLLIKIVSLLLVFCNQKETYYIIMKIIEMDLQTNDTGKIRWHFRYNSEDNQKLVSSVIESLDEIANSGKIVCSHFDKINFPSNTLFSDMALGFFIDYLSFDALTRLFPFFMLEGVKSIYRINYALIKYLKTEILKLTNPDEVLKFVKLKLKEITDINTIFNNAYGFKLNRNNNKYEFQKLSSINFQLNQKSSFYLPNIERLSDLLSHQDIINLWPHLPDNMKIGDLKCLFSTEKHGYSVKSIYALTENTNFNSNILLLLETKDKKKLGAVFSNLFKLTNDKYVRPLYSKLIQFHPKLQTFKPNVSSDDIVYCSYEYIMIGGGPNGPALMIDGDLQKGFSSDDNCFKFPKFSPETNGVFEIVRVEIYLFN